jgi:integrase/recombinase XerD
MEQFKEWMVSKGFSKYTIAQMIGDVKKFLKEYKEVNTRTVQQFVDKQVKAGKDSKTSYSKYLSMRKYAKFLGKTLGEVEYPKVIRNVSAINTMSLREFTDLSRWIRKIDVGFGFYHMRDKVIIILLMLGLRRSEMLSLEIDDFDFENERIKFIGKGKKGAFVPMMNQPKYLKSYLEIRDDLYGEMEPGNKSFLVYKYNKRYKPLRERELYKILHDLTQRAIGRKVNPHCFRHSIATLMLDGGTDLMVIKDTLRHESILTTQIYTHISKTKVKEALENVSPLFQ